MTRSSDSTVALGSGPVATISVGLGILTMRNFSSTWIDATVVARARALLRGLEEISTALRTAEPKSRSDLVGVQFDPQAAFEREILRIDWTLENLDGLIAGNLSHRHRLDDLRRPEAGRSLFRQSTLELRREEGLEAALRVNDPDRGRKLRERLQELVELSLAEEFARRLARTLSAGWGREVKVVSDDRKALEAWLHRSFDVILMDLRMTEMCGFQTVASIRDGERKKGQRIPILAQTTPAKQGNDERCLESGLDEDRSRPIRPLEPREVLDGRGKLEPADRPTVPERPAPVESGGIEFDRDRALITVCGDEELLAEVIGIFLEDCPRLLGEIEQALAVGDRVLLARLAHTVRGVSCTLALNVVHQVASCLETSARAGPLHEARAAFRELCCVLDRVRPQLEAVVAGGRDRSIPITG